MATVKLLVDEQEVRVPQKLLEQLGTPEGRQGLANSSNQIGKLEKKVTELEEMAKHNVEAKRKANEEAKNYRLERQDLEDKVNELEQERSNFFENFSSDGMEIKSFKDLMVKVDEVSSELPDVDSLQNDYEKMQKRYNSVLEGERQKWQDRISGFYEVVKEKGEDGKEVEVKKLKPGYDKLYELFRKGDEETPLTYEDIRYNETILKASDIFKQEQKESVSLPKSPLAQAPNFPSKQPINENSKQARYEAAKKAGNPLEMLKNL